MKNRPPCFIIATLGFVVAVALVMPLTGCVGYGDESYAFAAQDDYVYYPDYECYYSVSRHQYAYREGNAWFARPAPRGVSVKVLLASPSVRMGFHDSPAHHHAEIMKRYPRNWRPATVGHSRPNYHKNGQQWNDGGR